MLEHLVRRLHLVARPLVSLVGNDHLPQGALLPRELGQLRVVGGDLWTRHLGLDLVVTASDSL